jgi:hypothetical protein
MRDRKALKRLDLRDYQPEKSAFRYQRVLMPFNQPPPEEVEAFGRRLALLLHGGERKRAEAAIADFFRVRAEQNDTTPEATPIESLGLDPVFVGILAEQGYCWASDVLAVNGETLLAIKGIGPFYLDSLRAALRKRFR